MPLAAEAVPVMLVGEKQIPLEIGTNAAVVVLTEPASVDVHSVDGIAVACTPFVTAPSVDTLAAGVNSSGTGGIPATAARAMGALVVGTLAAPPAVSSAWSQAAVVAAVAAAAAVASISGVRFGFVLCNVPSGGAGGSTEPAGVAVGLPATVVFSRESELLVGLAEEVSSCLGVMFAAGGAALSLLRSIVGAASGFWAVSFLTFLVAALAASRR